MPPVTLEQARAAKTAAKTRLARMDAVVGIGITRVGHGYAIKVNLREPLPAGVHLPATIDDVPLVVEVVGAIHPR
jgi:hypothetical protein